MYEGVKFKDPRERRLAYEHQLIEDVVKKSSKISYSIVESTRSNKIPTKYRITYRLKSIIGINKDQSPVFGQEHTAEITLPPGYPGASDPPLCVMTSDVWHPNIRAHEPFKGRICVNSKAISAAHGIDDLVLRIGEILQYKNYLAEDRPPYPEDVIVAKWVREYAEPQGLVSWQDDKVIDDSSLLDGIPDSGAPEPEIPAQEPEEEKPVKASESEAEETASETSTEASSNNTEEAKEEVVEAVQSSSESNTEEDDILIDLGGDDAAEGDSSQRADEDDDDSIDIFL